VLLFLLLFFPITNIRCTSMRELSSKIWSISSVAKSAGTKKLLQPTCPRSLYIIACGYYSVVCNLFSRMHFLKMSQNLIKWDYAQAYVGLWNLIQHNIIIHQNTPLLFVILGFVPISNNQQHLSLNLLRLGRINSAYKLNLEECKFSSS